ncbi:MAG: glutamate-5-semialdehyde dehydrogenase [Endomicrobia bacterium]|nr:glutamate-5-semialdehyde dehydrogenase [Endomicrobiia bacterium]
MVAKNIWINKVKKIKENSYKFSNLSSPMINKILVNVKKYLSLNKEIILSENKKDINLAKKSNLSAALIDRLTITDKRFKEMVNSIDTVISLESPINLVIDEWKRNLPSGDLTIRKIRVPLGVIFMVYESRPNVTVDSAVLCIKSGNCVVLRGGSETINTNKMLANVIKTAIKETIAKYNLKISDDVVLFVDDRSYDVLYDILKLYEYIDLVIPRGSEKMINTIKENSLIPVLSHGSGICHTYVDSYADLNTALKVCLNAKVQRPSVCNAMETLLVHKDIAEKFLPEMCKLYIKNNVELRGCRKTVNFLKKYGIKIKVAKEIDWKTEYLDYILSIKVVESIDEAIWHINYYGSHHSDSIITENKFNKEKFEKEVDSSAIFVNSSTRLHDGGVFGFGTEIGISTSKLHARGTMGINELTTTKYIVEGNGTIRE